MSKRTKSARDEEDYIELEDSEEEFIDDGSDDDYGGKPKKKKAGKAKASPPKSAKKKAAKEGEEGAEPKPKKPKAPKPPEVPTTLADGWTVHPTSLIYKANPAAQGGAKIAAIDLDGTMIARKSTNQWGPKDADDWKWLTATVPAKIKELHEGGYKLVIFTNQGSIKGAMLGAASDKIRAMIDNVLKGLSTAAGTAIPAQVLIATTNDNFRKPGTGMWEFFVENLNGGVAPDLAESFFVGDAAGRSEDINGGAASDKEFAAAIGIKFILPEDFWPKDDSPASGNAAMSSAFRELAGLIRKAGDGFKANAFFKVATILDEYPDAITSAKQVKDVKGVGKSSLAKIDEFLTTGKLAAIEELKGGGPAPPPQTKDEQVGMAFL